MTLVSVFGQGNSSDGCHDAKFILLSLDDQLENRCSRPDEPEIESLFPPLGPHGD